MAPLRVVFTTLFLGIVSGPQLVELDIEGAPAQIELRLDGALLASLSRPPWRAVVDFGADPRPRELVATALDRAGAVVGRERQFVNVARPPAEVELVLDRDMAGRPVGARVAWGTVEGRLRPEVSIRLDGQALVVDASGRAALPPIAGGPARVLSAEVKFSPAVVARRDLVLGGEWSDELSTEATALAVTAASPLASVAALSGSILIGGEPAMVVALEEGPAQVLLIRSLSARLAARRLGGIGRRPQKFTSSFSAGNANNRFDLGDSAYGRFDLPLGREDRVRIVWPVATRSPGASLPTRLFDVAPDFTARDGGMLWLLTALSHPDAGGKDPDAPRFADAVAVGGLQAMAGGRRRAVVLVLGDETTDRSFYTPAQARAYLKALRVPLVVWSLEPRPSPLAAAWGPVADVSSRSKLRRAVDALRTLLDTQRVVWVPGLHLPGSVELTAAARSRGLSWAGEPSPLPPLP